jgi:Na+-driven multidrug efflux pump
MDDRSSQPRTTLQQNGNRDAMSFISLMLMIAARLIMIRGHSGPGNKMAPDGIAVVGWANRLLVVVYCVWVVTIAREALKLRRKPSQSM